MKAAKLKAGMRVQFRSLGQRGEVIFSARVLAVREPYAIVQDETKYGPRHVRIDRLWLKKEEFWEPKPPEGPRYA